MNFNVFERPDVNNIRDRYDLVCAFEVIDGERENGEMGIHAQASYGRIRASGGC